MTGPGSPAVSGLGILDPHVQATGLLDLNQWGCSLRGAGAAPSSKSGSFPSASLPPHSTGVETEARRGRRR